MTRTSQLTIDGREEKLESHSKRGYTVLEEVYIDDEAAEELGIAGTLYRVVKQAPARNAKHAIQQAAQDYEGGVTVKLIGVSDRMFQTHTVSIEAQTRVSVA